MSDGIPLNDDDRKPWIAKVSDWIDSHCMAGRDGIISCSAPKIVPSGDVGNYNDVHLFTYVAPENYSHVV